MTGIMAIGPGFKLALLSSSSSCVDTLMGIFSSSLMGVGVSTGVYVLSTVNFSSGFLITLYLT